MFLFSSGVPDFFLSSPIILLQETLSNLEVTLLSGLTFYSPNPEGGPSDTPNHISNKL